MSSNVTNQVPYLRTSRSFPEDSQALSVELSKSYIDIANNVNSRTIGLFPTSRPAITGESWYLVNNQRQQTFRQAYRFTTFAAINHGITTANIYGFTRIFGSFTDGTSFYPLPYVHSTAANQVGVIVTATQITFVVGGGAPVPTLGTIVLEYLSQS